MPNRYLVQIVEDDAPIRNLISLTLKANDYKYICSEDGETAVMMAASHNPDIILLDLGLPDLDGVEVIKKIRSWSQIPIIVISARSDYDDKVEALDAGADDYLTKPFSVDELMARLRVFQRRISSVSPDGAGTPSFTNGDLTIDFVAGCAYMKGKELKLTPIEYKLLCLLANNQGRVLTHNYITEKIWAGSAESSIGSLRVFMATLRKKLEDAGDGRQYIQTHVNVGYRMLKADQTDEK